MSGNSRVQNLSRGYSMKFRQAEKAVVAGACAWVKYGVSVRDLSVAEAIQARNEQAAKREPLPFAEIHGLRYEPAAKDRAGYQAERKLAWRASVFAATGQMEAA